MVTMIGNVRINSRKEEWLLLLFGAMPRFGFLKPMDYFFPWKTRKRQVNKYGNIN